MEAVCTLREILKGYGSRAPKALGPLSLDIFPGELIGVRGENGAGKSTLLSILAGVLKPDAGEVWTAPELPGRVGYAPQEPALYETLSGLDNLRFWGRVHGLPKKPCEARCRWLLREMNLEEKAKAPAGAYSGGMKRRLHLATALMGTPKLLLLDEPTAGADEASAQLMLSMVKQLGEQGCSVVLVSHRRGELEQVCTRFLTLSGGRAAEEERP